MSLSKLPIIPLEKIVGHLDIQSRRNLLKATKFNDLGILFHSITSKKKFACPVCAFEAGPMNLYKLPTGELEGDYKDRSHVAKYMQRLEEFNFFSQFRHVNVGNENYAYEAACVTEEENVLYSIIPKYEKLDNYKKIRFFSSDYEDHAHWWLSNYVTVLQNVRNGNEFHQKEKKRLERIFFGAEVDGFSAGKRMHTFNKMDFQEHIRNHCLKDLDCDIEFEEWIEKYGKMDKKFEADIEWYSEHDTILDFDDLEELVQCILVARYYRCVQSDTMEKTAELLGNKDAYMWNELRKIFTIARNCLKDVRFPRRSLCQTDIGLYKFLDMYTKAFEAVLGWSHEN